MPVVLNNIVTPAKHKSQHTKPQQNSSNGNRNKLSKADLERIKRFEEAQRLDAWYRPYVDLPFHIIMMLCITVAVLIALSLVVPNENPKVAQ